MRIKFEKYCDRGNFHGPKGTPIRGPKIVHVKMGKPHFRLMFYAPNGNCWALTISYLKKGQDA